MNNTLEFINTKDIKKIDLFSQLKCKEEEAKILQHLTKQYVLGISNIVVVDVLSNFYDIKTFKHLEKIPLIKNLLELGWIIQTSLLSVKVSEISSLELINTTISLSSSFLKLLEVGSLELVLPEIKEYADHLEYLQDQFFKIDLAQQLNIVKHNFDDNSPNIHRLKSKLTLLENRIKERINTTKEPIMLESFFKEYDFIYKRKSK